MYSLHDEEGLRELGVLHISDGSLLHPTISNIKPNPISSSFLRSIGG